MANFKQPYEWLQRKVLNGLSEEKLRIEYATRMRGISLDDSGKASSNIIPSHQALRTVSISEWRNAVNLAQSPYTKDRRLLYSVYDRVLIDTELSRLIQKQVDQAKKAKYRLIDPNGEEDTEAIKIFENLWYWDYVKHVIESDYYGHSLIEFFDMKEKQSTIKLNNGRASFLEFKKVSLIKREHVKSEDGLWLVEENDTEGYSFRIPEMWPYYMEAGTTHGLGNLMKICPIEITKRYAISTWSEFNEKIAFPFRWATMPTGNKKRQRAMAGILKNMGSAGWGIFHKGEEVKLLEMHKTDPHKCFLEMMSYVDRKLEAFIEGEGLKNEMGEGSFAADQVRSDMKSDRYQTNKIYLEYFGNDELLPRLIKHGYPLEGYRLECDDRRDIPVEKQIQIDAELLKHYKISPTFISKRYGIPEEEIMERVGTEGFTDDTVQNLADFLTEKKKPEAQHLILSQDVAQITAKAHGKLFAQMDAYYGDVCPDCGKPSMQDSSAFPNFNEFFASVAKRVFDKKLKSGEIDPETWQAISDIFADNIQKGFGLRLADATFGEPNHTLLSNLLENAQVFAAFKNHQNVRQMVSLLVDENGKARSFSKFKELAMELNEQYNANWLQAEYQTARLTARQANNWTKLQENADQFPYLRYITVGDERVRKTHEALHGINLPINHVFWDTHYAPNGFRCRCRQEQNNDEQVNAPDDLPEIKDGFGFNAGKQGIITNQDHPYYKKASTRATTQANSFVAQNVVKNFTPSKSIAEAQRLAINGGLASKVNYNGIGLEVANTVNKQLMKLKNLTGSTFGEITSFAGGEVLATETILKGNQLVLRLNKTVLNTFETVEELNQFISTANARGWTVGSSLSDAISHEFGHLLTLNNTALLQPETLLQSLNLSAVASQGLNETLAEIFSLYIKEGKSALSEQAIALFNLYSNFTI